MAQLRWWCGRVLCVGLMTVTLVSALAGAVRAEDAARTPGASEDEEARELFLAGRAAYEDGRFEEALGYFRRAHALSGRPELLFNVGQAADRARLDREAVEAWEAYLAAVPESPNRHTVETRVRALRRAMERQEAEAAQAAVPTPREAAEADAAAEPRVRVVGTDTAQDDRGGIHTKWWLWTAVGAVVVAAVVTGVLVSRGSSGTGVGDPIAGDGGVILQALGRIR